MELLQVGAIRRGLNCDLLEGTADLTPDLATKIAKLIDSSEDFWLNMQCSYDAAHQDTPETVASK